MQATKCHNNRLKWEERKRETDGCFHELDCQTVQPEARVIKLCKQLYEVHNKN